MSIVFLSTFIIFTLEALLHYNIGRNGLTAFSCPSFDEVLKIIGVVAFFSAINSFIINKLEKNQKK